MLYSIHTCRYVVDGVVVCGFLVVGYVYTCIQVGAYLHRCMVEYNARVWMLTILVWSCIAYMAAYGHRCALACVCKDGPSLISKHLHMHMYVYVNAEAPVATRAERLQRRGAGGRLGVEEEIWVEEADDAEDLGPRRRRDEAGGGQLLQHHRELERRRQLREAELVRVA